MVEFIEADNVKRQEVLLSYVKLNVMHVIHVTSFIGNFVFWFEILLRILDFIANTELIISIKLNNVTQKYSKTVICSLEMPGPPQSWRIIGE